MHPLRPVRHAVYISRVHPFNTGCLPLSYSGNPGVNWRILQGGAPPCKTPHIHISCASHGELAHPRVLPSSGQQRRRRRQAPCSAPPRLCQRQRERFRVGLRPGPGVTEFPKVCSLKRVCMQLCRHSWLQTRGTNQGKQWLSFCICPRILYLCSEKDYRQ